MKEQYRWNYTIKIKTKDGTYEYEKETLDNIDLLLEKHLNYEELKATKVENSGKKLVKKIGGKRNEK
jgi:hypothetical protein